jgi:hypothetical protein
MSRIAVLYHPDSISCFFSLFPLIASRHHHLFVFVRSLEEALSQRQTSSLIILRFFKKNPGYLSQGSELIHRLRGRYSKIIFFDDSDGADSLHGGILEDVDLYFKKSLLVERSRYLKDAYGRQIYSDYYHRCFGAVDAIPKVRKAITDPFALTKLRLSWNLGIGLYPISRAKMRLGLLMERLFGPTVLRPLLKSPNAARPTFGSRAAKIQARYSSIDSTSVGYQRELFARAASGSPLFLMGKVPSRQFRLEIGRVAGALSPFGWGEICYRDFEAILNGALLLKPDMSHLETWPNTYKPFTSYIPLAWDCSDLLERTEEALQNFQLLQHAPQEALEILINGYASLESRVEEFINICT